MSSISPISLASIIIGFISFFLTILTWANVFWGALYSILDAPEQVVAYLPTIRQRLCEERAHAKKTRKKCWSAGGGKSEGCQGVYWEGGPARVMNDALKELIHDFKTLEQPFLIPPHSGREKDLEWSCDTTERYYRCDLGHRIKWIQSRKDVMDVERRLNALQIRRIAVEVSENQRMLKDMMGIMRKIEGKMSAS